MVATASKAVNFLLINLLYLSVGSVFTRYFSICSKMYKIFIIYVAFERNEELIKP